jgi:hypothetical protein
MIGIEMQVPDGFAIFLIREHLFLEARYVITEVVSGSSLCVIAVIRAAYAEWKKWSESL